MIKRLLCALVALMTTAAMAANVDVNKANQAELEALKGIGPSLATKMLEERKKGNFKDWADLAERVKGVGPGNAAKLSAAGLTVGDAAFKAAPSSATKEAATKAPRSTAKKADTQAKP